MNETDGSGPVDRDVGPIIAALIRETDDHGSARIQLGEVHALRDELDRLRAEVEALRADAQRYRWLRDGGTDDVGDGPWCEAMDALGRLWGPERIDAAIDAAMKEAAADVTPNARAKPPKVGLSE